MVSGAALKAAAAAAAQAAAAVSLSAWLSESDGGQEGGRREGGQLLMCVVGDKSLQTNRRLLDQHVSCHHVGVLDRSMHCKSPGSVCIDSVQEC